VDSLVISGEERPGQHASLPPCLDFVRPRMCSTIQPSPSYFVRSLHGIVPTKPTRTQAELGSRSRIERELLRWTEGGRSKNFVREELHCAAGLARIRLHGCDRGEMDVGVDGVVSWLDCECGARIARRADDGDVLDVNL
jgi:hypothetical protein